MKEILMKNSQNALSNNYNGKKIQSNISTNQQWPKQQKEKKIIWLDRFDLLNMGVLVAQVVGAAVTEGQAP